ncbi:MAG: VOC family protein [Pseudomonadota bacterium]|nr:VOC family protein [Pseudomonadota bacterium]
MTTTVRPFLMFEGRAEEAMDFYVSLFEDGEVLEVSRYGKDGPGAEGSVIVATFRIGGQTAMCSDSPAKHAFTFTPSVSLFVTCRDEAEIRRLAAALDSGDNVFMPLGDYGFSRLFAWVGDQFGVTWQLNLP